MNNNILVAGATGRTGRIIVRKLVQRGITPHVLVRDLHAAQRLFGGRVTCHQGDVRKEETLSGAMAGMTWVVSAIGAQMPVGKNCPKRVDFEGVAHLVQAAFTQGVRRFVLISSIAVTRLEHPMNCFGKILDWKLKGEDILRKSGLDYVIVRPGGLKDIPGGRRKLLLDQGDRITGTISRADIAEISLHALQYPQPLHTTFEAVEVDCKGRPDWKKLFSSLIKD